MTVKSLISLKKSFRKEVEDHDFIHENKFGSEAYTVIR